MSRSWFIAAAVGAGLLVTHGFGLSLTPALLPNISESLGGEYAALATALGLGLGAYSLGAISAGRLLERVSVRPLLVATFVAPGLVLLIMSNANSEVVIGIGAVLLGANAGLSWPASLHAMGMTIPAHARTTAMSGAGAGVGVGMIVNGLLVQLAEGPIAWSGAFRIAAAITILPVILTWFVMPGAIEAPTSTGERASFRAALRSPIGRVIALAGLAGGLVGFPVIGFMSVVATETFGVSAGRVSALWMITGVSGIVVSPLVGKLGQRRTPLFGLIFGAACFAAVLFAYAFLWRYELLAVTAGALTLYYYPVWGLSGALADQTFESSIAVRAVSLGLVGAAAGGLIGNTSAGHWFDATGSFRTPIVIAGLLMIGLVAAFAAAARSDQGLAQMPTMRNTNVQEGS